MKAVKALTLLVLLALLASVIPACNTAASVVQYYAKIVKYPTLAYPEPVVIGKALEVRVVLPENVKPSDVSLTISNPYYGSYALKMSSDPSYSAKWKAWILKFIVSEDVKPGLYDFTLKFSAGGKSYNIVMPHAVWVLEKEPEKLKIIVTGDTKTPAGKPYWFEMVAEANLIHPDAFFFDGDEVDRPTMMSAWLYFLQGWLSLQIPSYAIIGNHEYEKANEAVTWSNIMGYRNYSVTIGKFLILALDSGMDGWVPMSQLQWAENILKNNPDKVKIMIFHHPLFGYKIRDEKIAEIKVNSIDDFDNLLKKGYIYGSWTNHPKEAKKLFSIILKYGVHLVFTAHTHTDINNVVVYNGTKYYFITMSGVPFDVREKDKRGFRLITVYANGSFTANTLTYPPGAPLNKYPNSIPIDSGEGTVPYILGLIDYYYSPSNDGKHHAVSFKAINHLNETFSNIFIEFKLPKDIPISKYKIIPKPPKVEVIETSNYYYLRILNVNLTPNSVVQYTVAATPDNDKPQISDKVTITQSKKDPTWFEGVVSVTDKGWGVKDVKVYYSTDGGKSWKEAQVYDINTPTSLSTGSVVLNFWIKGLTSNALLNITAIDFANHTTFKIFKYANGEVTTFTTTTTTSSTATSSPTTTSSSVPTTSSTTISTSTTTTTTTTATTTSTTSTSTTSTTTSTTLTSSSTSPTTVQPQTPSGQPLSPAVVIGVGIVAIVIVGVIMYVVLRKSAK